jgi:hypothetical protein
MRSRTDNSSDCLQVEDIIFRGRWLRVVVPFDSYYSRYGDATVEKKNLKKPRKIPEYKNDEWVETYQRRLFKCPWLIKYYWNDSGEFSFKARPEVWIVVKSPKFIKVKKEIIQQIIKYCEDQAIYDKLGKYGDFYYNLKKHV